MTGETTATVTAAAVSGMGSGFLLDPATYAAGAGLGFSGIDFYFAGRGGALGDTDADVVTAALVFFSPDTVRAGWDGSADVMPRLDAAKALADCGARWADEHLADGVDWARLAELAGRVVAGASPAVAPIFAGWRRLPVPADPKQAAWHQLNALRELRMPRHGAAVLAAGLDVADAVRHHQPYMVGVYGWSEAPLADDVAERWDEAERLTNRASAHDYAVLDDDDAADFARLCEAAMAAIS
jgi:hypothetical protein